MVCGGVREPRVGNKAIPIACRERERKITRSQSTKYLSTLSTRIFVRSKRSISDFWRNSPRPFPFLSFFLSFSFFPFYSPRRWAEFNRLNPRARRALNLCQRLGLFSQIKDSGGEIDTRSTGHHAPQDSRRLRSAGR